MIDARKLLYLLLDELLHKQQTYGQSIFRLKKLYNLALYSKAIWDNQYKWKSLYI